MRIDQVRVRLTNLYMCVCVAVLPRGLMIITCFSQAKNMQLTEGCGGAELHRRQLELQQPPAARIHN